MQVKQSIEKLKSIILMIILVSGDSWEREFDETDVVTSKSNLDPLTRSEETITSESLSSSTTAPIVSSSTEKKKKTNEFDDEWESWS
jgi:hypothetical protein